MIEASARSHWSSPMPMEGVISIVSEASTTLGPYQGWWASYALPYSAYCWHWGAFRESKTEIDDIQGEVYDLYQFVLVAISHETGLTISFSPFDPYSTAVHSKTFWYINKLDDWCGDIYNPSETAPSAFYDSSPVSSDLRRILSLAISLP